MGNVTFAGQEHRAFYEDMLERSGNSDCYHQALFYALGACDDTRRHIESLFDFNEGGIRPEGLEEPWQTGGSSRLTRLAFNLWNGYTIEGSEEISTPYNLFDCSFAPFMLEAIRLRYPEYSGPFAYFRV